MQFSTRLPTIAIARVLRDERLKLVPCNLLVEGDVVVMGHGEKSVARVKSIFFENAAILQREDIIKPNYFPDNHEREEFHGISFENMFFFRVLESPIINILESSLKFERPQTVISEHLSIIENLFNSKIVWGLMIFSLGVNALLLFAPQNYIGSSDAFYYDIIGYFQVLAVLPVLPISIPFLLVIARSFGNAYILTLFNALESSKTEFEDTEDVDEFDSAPAPTKDLKLSWSSIFNKFIFQLLNYDGSQSARMAGLIDVINCN